VTLLVSVAKNYPADGLCAFFLSIKVKGFEILYNLAPWLGLGAKIIIILTQRFLIFLCLVVKKKFRVVKE